MYEPDGAPWFAGLSEEEIAEQMEIDAAEEAYHNELAEQMFAELPDDGPVADDIPW